MWEQGTYVYPGPPGRQIGLRPPDLGRTTQFLASTKFASPPGGFVTVKPPNLGKPLDFAPSEIIPISRAGIEKLNRYYHPSSAEKAALALALIYMAIQWGFIGIIFLAYFYLLRDFYQNTFFTEIENAKFNAYQSFPYDRIEKARVKMGKEKRAEVKKMDKIPWEVLGEPSWAKFKVAKDLRRDLYLRVKTLNKNAIFLQFKNPVDIEQLILFSSISIYIVFYLKIKNVSQKKISETSFERNNIIAKFFFFK